MENQPTRQTRGTHDLFHFKTDITAWNLWLTPVILATQEAGIMRTAVQNQPRKIVLGTLS
jgi:hypothetical protein